MTKTLTEQWREGTLAGGDYYIKTIGLGIDKIIINYYEEELKQFDGLCDCSVAEVLAPVPSYDEFNELKTRVFISGKMQEVAEMVVGQLEKKLAIATKALKEYAEEGNWCDCSDWNDMVYQNDLVRCCENGMFGKDGFKPAQKALKEMEGVK